GALGGKNGEMNLLFRTIVFVFCAQRTYFAHKKSTKPLGFMSIRGESKPQIGICASFQALVASYVLQASVRRSQFHKVHKKSSA
ncbi:MAG: hypothetical protein ACI92G_003603, partial [Candidatus Pelagisphaera sp.]